MTTERDSRYDWNRLAQDAIALDYSPDDYFRLMTDLRREAYLRPEAKTLEQSTAADAYEQCRAFLVRAQELYPDLGLTFGYLGNCGTGFDDRAWYFFSRLKARGVWGQVECKFGGVSTARLLKLVQSTRDGSFERWVKRVRRSQPSKLRCAECGVYGQGHKDDCLCEVRGNLDRIQKMMDLDCLRAAWSKMSKRAQAEHDANGWSPLYRVLSDHAHWLHYQFERMQFEGAEEARERAGYSALMAKYGPLMNEAQREEIDYLTTRIFIKGCYGYVYTSEFKTLEIEVQGRRVYLLTRVGGVHDEGTAASLLCRDYRHISIGVRGGEKLLNVKDKSKAGGRWNAIHQPTY